MFKEIEQFMRPFSSLSPFNNLSPLAGIGHPLFAVRSDLKDGVYSYSFPVPGVAKENVSVRIAKGNRLVVGYRFEQKSENGQKESSSVFEVPLPEDADKESVEAVVNDGVVLVTLEKVDDGKDDIEVTVK